MNFALTNQEITILNSLKDSLKAQLFSYVEKTRTHKKH